MSMTLIPLPSGFVSMIKSSKWIELYSISMMSFLVSAEYDRNAVSSLVNSPQCRYIGAVPSGITHTAFGSDTSTKSGVCAWILTSFPFGSDVPVNLIGSPSSSFSRFIICIIAKQVFFSASTVAYHLKRFNSCSPRRADIHIPRRQ